VRVQLSRQQEHQWEPKGAAQLGCDAAALRLDAGVFHHPSDAGLQLSQAQILEGRHI
jgi:hypothetical protein